MTTPVAPVQVTDRLVIEMECGVTVAARSEVGRWRAV